MTMRDDSNSSANNDHGLPQDPAVQALYRQLPPAQPPAALDDAILAAARRAAGSKPRPVPVWQRWRIPLAAAASLLLSVLVLRHTVVTPGVGEPADLGQYSVSERNASAPVAHEDVAAEAVADGPPPAAAPDPDRHASESALAKATDRATPEKKSAPPPPAERAPAERAPAERAVVALREERVRVAEEDRAPAVAAAPAPVSAVAPPAAAEAEAADVLMARSKVVARGDVAAVAAAGAAEARQETVAASAVMSAPVAAAAAAKPGQSATGARPGSWPFGLLPTLSPEVACARLAQDAGGSCSGRTEGGALVLRLTGADRDWPERLQEALADLGWLPDPAAGAGHYRRSLPTGDLLAWRSPAPGVLEVRLQPAASP